MLQHLDVPRALLSPSSEMSPGPLDAPGSLLMQPDSPAPTSPGRSPRGLKVPLQGGQGIVARSSALRGETGSSRNAWCLLCSPWCSVFALS